MVPRAVPGLVICSSANVAVGAIDSSAAGWLNLASPKSRLLADGDPPVPLVTKMFPGAGSWHEFHGESAAEARILGFVNDAHSTFADTRAQQVVGNLFAREIHPARSIPNPGCLKARADSKNGTTESGPPVFPMTASS